MRAHRATAAREAARVARPPFPRSGLLPCPEFHLVRLIPGELDVGVTPVVAVVGADGSGAVATAARYARDQASSSSSTPRIVSRHGSENLA